MCSKIYVINFIHSKSTNLFLFFSVNENSKYFVDCRKLSGRNSNSFLSVENKYFDNLISKIKFFFLAASDFNSLVYFVSLWWFLCFFAFSQIKTLTNRYFMRRSILFPATKICGSKCAEAANSTLFSFTLIANSFNCLLMRSSITHMYLNHVPSLSLCMIHFCQRKNRFHWQELWPWACACVSCGVHDEWKTVSQSNQQWEVVQRVVVEL